MNIIHDVFLKTLKLGENLFHIHYSDHEDAYAFSEKNFSVHTDHLLDFFENHTNCEKYEYEFDLIRFVLVKAVEHRVSADIFGNTSRGNVCDVFYSPFDISMKKYPTNLPIFLEKEINTYQKEGMLFASRILELESNDRNFELNRGMLNAVMFIGMTFGYKCGHDNLIYKGYKTSDMLTRNEINQWSVHNLCNWFSGNGFKIGTTNHTRDTMQNIIMSKDGVTFHVLIAAEIAPENPGFPKEDMDNFYEAATESGAVPLAASINLGSADKKHFDDGVLLYGDQVMYNVLSVIQVEPKE